MTRWDPAQSDGRTRIKICGIQDPDMAMVAVEAGADAIGLVHHPPSPRHVSEDTAATIRRVLPAHVPAVDVVVDPPVDDLHRFPSWIQFHGDESAAIITRAIGPVVRGFSFDPARLLAWDHCPDVSLLLVDGPGKGAGDPFDHAALVALMPRIRTPLVLAGGLSCDGVGDAIERVRPWGVDVSSGVESSRGRKDPARIRAFCEAVRAVDRT